MNERIKKKKITLKKKREHKELTRFIRTIKRAVMHQMMMTSVPATPSFEQQCRMIEETYRNVCENAGYTVSDIILTQSDHPGVILITESSPVPNYVPINIEIIRGRRMSQIESDLVAIQDPIDTTAYDDLLIIQDSNEIWPSEKMFTIGFKIYHNENGMMLWVNFDSEFKARIIDSNKYYWKFVIAINDCIPFIHEKDGWMLDNIEEAKSNKNVWHFFESFNIPLSIGSIVKIKCCITDPTSDRRIVIADEWKLGAGDYWDPHPRSRRFYHK